MFTSITMKNFKSFGNVTADFSDRQGNPKPLIILYGQNGYGKSNLASAFYFLVETMQTLDAGDMLQSILNNLPQHTDNGTLIDILKNKFKDIKAIIKDNKMIGSSDNLVLEFSFLLNGKKGKYIISTDDEKIVYEKLEYVLQKNRGTIFEISKEKKTFNKKAFIDDASCEEITDLAAKYWGKHSLLAILQHEFNEKANSYYDDKLSENFLKLMTAISRLSVSVNYGSYNQNYLSLQIDNIENITHGTIPKSDYHIFKAIGTTASKFFVEALDDVLDAHYDFEPQGDKINYQLIVKKKIFGKERNIPFYLESSGTQSLMRFLPYIINTIIGDTTIIDEFDSVLHERLTINLLESLKNQIKGQLILTTHTQTLMDADIPYDSIYIISKENDDKTIKCVLDNKIRVNKNSSIKGRYLDGKYDSNKDKESTYFDFKKLINTFQSTFENIENDSSMTKN